jgi:hypothetical protein
MSDQTFTISADVGGQESSEPPIANRKSQIANRFISLEEASRRSGKSLGHLRRLCADKWISEDKARIVRGGGKRTRYEVAEDAYPAFSRVKFPEQIGTDLRQYTQAQREAAVGRKNILDAWERAKASRHDLGFTEAQITAQFLSRMRAQEGGHSCLPTPSRATLYNWYNAWRAGGLEGLIDGRSVVSGQLSVATDNGQRTTDPFLEEVQRLYLLPRSLKLTVCREIALLTAAERGWAVRSYFACQRHIAKLPRGVVTLNRKGNEAFENFHQPFIERDYTTLQSNEMWVSDHHQFDVIVNDRGELVRPWLTAWQDMRSRKFVGWQIYGGDPNSQRILTAFKSACVEHGVPSRVYIDNGKDYDSYALNGRTKKDRWRKRHGSIDMQPALGAFAQLGIEITHAKIYHGQSKPIERWFGTIEQSVAVWETYCGRSTLHKPEDLQQNLERGKAPLLADFVAWADQLLHQLNATPSTAAGLGNAAPDQVFAANLFTKRTAPREVLEEICTITGKPVTIGQNGVRYNGLFYGQYEQDLLLNQGKQVIVRGDESAASVRVYWPDGRFLTIAQSNAQLPANATAAEIREASKSRAKAKKVVREFYQTARVRAAEDLPDLILLGRQAANARVRSENGSTPGAPGPSPNLRPIQTPMIEQIKAAQTAFNAHQNLRPTGTESASPGFSYSALSTQHSALDEDDGGFTYGGGSDADQ